MNEQEIKKIFYAKLLAITKKDKGVVNKFINAEQSYKNAIHDILNYIETIIDNDISFGGVYLFSEPGVGKTTILKALHATIGEIQMHKFRKPMYHFFRDMNEDISSFKNIDQQIDLGYNQINHLIIDDFTEKLNTISHFKYVFSLEEVLINRHRIWTKHNFNTVISSNIHPDEFNRFMGARPITRFQEQFLLIELLGDNKRIQKKIII